MTTTPAAPAAELEPAAWMYTSGENTHVFVARKGNINGIPIEYWTETPLYTADQLQSLIEERDRLREEVAGADQRAAFAESRLHAFRQSRAARAKTLAEFIKARAPELWPDYAAVSVNGALYDDEGFHPNYEREMNILRHRAEKAEEGLAEARAALAGEQ